MNLNKITYLLFLISGILLIGSCREDLSYREPSGSDNSAPGLISEPQVLNLPGKSIITYQLPSDQNLMYVKAEYKLKSGVTKEVKASYYSDTLVVDGFGDSIAVEREVKLYSVSQREVASAPTTVIIKPLRSPIWNIKKSIKVTSDYGGYKLTALNPLKAAIGLLVLKKNLLGEWVMDNDKSIFTSSDSIKSQIIGIDDPVELAFLVRDRWSSYTDTLLVKINPIYSKELDRSLFRDFTLPGDAQQYSGQSVSYMWDGLNGWGHVSFTDVYNSPITTPHMVTFDLGIQAKLTLLWILPYGESNLTKYYTLTTMKRFEVYGSVLPDLNGKLDDGNWKLLGTYSVSKPSGLPLGNETADDIKTAKAGFTFIIDKQAPKVQFIRIRCLENFGGTGKPAQSIDEIRVYGDSR